MGTCTLKERLISAPILGMTTDSGMFLLDSDASSVGLGAVISQMQNGKEVVIAYASRSLSNAERNYDTTKRELLVVIFGLRTVRQYLLGRKFTIRTDNSALQWLRKTPELWHRWPDGWRISNSLISRSNTGPKVNTAMPTDCRAIRLWMIWSMTGRH